MADDDDLRDSVALALRRQNATLADHERRLATLQSTVDELLHVLTATGTLQEGHRRLIQRVAERAAAQAPTRVRLRMWIDKYQVPNPDLDCAALLHLCHARCCSFSFDLTTQDLDEGVIKWEIERPYTIRHDGDGYCSHMDRPSLGCTAYGHRPAACRTFDCRQDRRVWLDFEQRLPAPMPDGLRPPRRDATS